MCCARISLCLNVTSSAVAVTADRTAFRLPVYERLV